jgi:hypothetical protein
MDEKRFLLGIPDHLEKEISCLNNGLWLDFDSILM